MIKVVSLLKSGTLRGLAVAAIAYGLQVIGLAEQFPNAEGALDAILNLAQIGGMVYAAIKRTFAPNPPLTTTAVNKEQEMIAKGTLEVRK